MGGKEYVTVCRGTENGRRISPTWYQLAKKEYVGRVCRGRIRVSGLPQKNAE